MNITPYPSSTWQAVAGLGVATAVAVVLDGAERLYRVCAVLIVVIVIIVVGRLGLRPGAVWLAACLITAAPLIPYVQAALRIAAGHRVGGSGGDGAGQTA